MSETESNLRVRRSLAKMTDTNADDWFLSLKARFGFEIIYRAIHQYIGPGTVLTTPYTCITSINPILSAKLTPVYLDISPDTLAVETLPPNQFGPDTRVLVIQHTLGHVGDKSDLIAKAKDQKLLVVEDSAHCLLRFARDSAEQPLADISIHSFGVEKILTGTKFGGAVYLHPRLKQNHPDLYNFIVKQFVELPEPSLGLAFRIRAYRYVNSFLQHLPTNIRQPLRQASIKTRLLEPAIYPYEQTGRQAEPCASNSFVNQRILDQLPSLPTNYKLRQANVEKFQAELHSNKFTSPFSDNTPEPLLAYPIIFDNADSADSAHDLLTRAGFYIRRWYKPLLYPGAKFNEIYHYDPATCPTAESISPRILCLPTDLNPDQTAKIIALLKTSIKNPE